MEAAAKPEEAKEAKERKVEKDDVTEAMNKLGKEFEVNEQAESWINVPITIKDTDEKSAEAAKEPKEAAPDHNLGKLETMTENLNLAQAQKEDQSSTPDLDTDWTVLNKSPSPEPSAEGAEGLLYPSLDDKKANEELPKVQVGPPRIQQQTLRQGGDISWRGHAVVPRPVGARLLQCNNAQKDVTAT